MEHEEKCWQLKAEALEHCSVYDKGAEIHVRLPSMQGQDRQACCMPAISFAPIAVEAKQIQGTFASGYRNCQCRWAFRQVAQMPDMEAAFKAVLTHTGAVQLAFMQQLPEEVVNALVEKCFLSHFKKGEIVLQSEADGEAFFIIQKGSVRVYNRSGDGRVAELSILKKGECFGEMSLLSGNPISTNVEALEACTLLSLPKRDFHNFLGSSPIFGVVLYRLLAERLRVTNKKVMQLMSPGVSGDLRIFNFIDLVQTIQASHMSGAIRVQAGPRNARFNFTNGKMVFAESAHFLGEEALDDILRWKGGSFIFDNQELEEEVNIEGDTMGLLLEAVRRLDETTGLQVSVAA